jgi:DUF1009 family protein
MPSGDNIILPERLGIIAGSGQLPADLVRFCKSNNVQPFVLGFEGQTDISCNLQLPLGQAQKMIDYLKENEVRDLVLIGGIRRPFLFNLRPDKRTWHFFLHYVLAHFGRRDGDHRLLSAVRQVLEEEGLTLHGIHRFLPDLLMPERYLGPYPPPPFYDLTIELGFISAKQHGAADKGQAVIVRNNQVLAREGRGGTSQLIIHEGQPGSILVKVCKPQQDRDLDLPTIGPETVRLAIGRKMAGIICEAGATLIVDRPQIERILKQHGQFFLAGISA